MVIQCPACQQRFRIADEKIGPQGVQVRCSKCKTQFPVRLDSAPLAAAPPEPAGPSSPPSPEPAPSSPPVPESSYEPTQVGAGAYVQEGASAPTPQDPSADRTVPNFAPVPLPPLPNDLVKRPEMGLERAKAVPAAAGFGAFPPPVGGPPVFDGVSTAGGDPFAATIAHPAPPPPDFGAPLSAPPSSDPFADPPGGGNAPSPSNGYDPFAEEEQDTAVDAGLKNSLLQQGGSFEQVELPAPERRPAVPAGFPPEITGSHKLQPLPPPPDFGSMDFDAAAAQAEEASAKAEVSEPEVIPRGPRPEDRKPKARKPGPAVPPQPIDTHRDPRAAYRLLLGVFFLGAAAAAFASLTNGTFVPGQIDRGRLALVLGAPHTEPSIAGLAMTTRTGGYVETAPGRPRIFVARGIAINSGNAAKGFFEVRGRLLDNAGKTLSETEVPCGNAFREDQLRELNSAEELARFYVPLGDGGTNARVEAGSAVSCTVVFFGAPPPSEVATYEMEIISAKPAA